MLHVPNTPYVLIADCRGGFIYKFNTNTLELTEYFDNPLLKPAPQDGVVFGVNGLKFSHGYLYFSNTNQEFVARIPATGNETSLSGTPELVVTNTSVDDFIVNGYNGDLYMADNGDNSLRYYKNGSNGSMTETLIGGPNTTNLLFPTAAIWAKGQEGRTLLVPSSGDPEQFVTKNLTGGGRINIIHLQ